MTLVNELTCGPSAAVVAVLTERQVFGLIVKASLVLVLEVVRHNRDIRALERTSEAQLPVVPGTVVA